MPNEPLILRAASLVKGWCFSLTASPTTSIACPHALATNRWRMGREVTDHVIAAPQGVTLTGIVSDMGGSQRPAAAWQEIVRIWQAAEPVRVVTEWETLDEMVIARCDANPSGRGMDFTMELRHIIRVSTSAGPLCRLPPCAGLPATAAAKCRAGVSRWQGFP